ncbi:MAG: branched-chain amino acid transport system permease protein [Solirubrobacteraceae bacterium]|nr:branched-chain amino acid transport system permease protein [Solirubrobacteraceae bacterium]
MESTGVTRVRGAALSRVATVFGLAAVAPLFFSPGGDVLNNMVLAAGYVVMALGLNIIVGFAGLLDLGYVAFFAIGAYTAAYFGSSFWANAGSAGRGIAILVGDSVAGRPGIHVNFLLILALAVATTAVAGTLIGVPTLRLRGDYIAVVTLAFGEIIGQIASNGRSIELFGGTLTPGPIGIGPIDPIELPLIGRLGRAVDLRPWYWFALALVALALVVNVNLRGSRVGRAWVAMRDDESAAACAGIPIVRTKLLAYGTGAAFGGVSGAFFASYLGFVNAAQFEFSFSIFILAMVVLGGLGSISGVVVGAIFLSVANNYLLPDVLFALPGKLGLAFDLSAISSGIYGAILVVVMLLRPHGLAPGPRTMERKATLNAMTPAEDRRDDVVASSPQRGGGDDAAVAVARAKSAEAIRGAVRAAYARDAGPPLRRCLACGVESHTSFEHCPACRTSYFERPPRLSGRARLALVAFAAVALVAIVPRIVESTQERAAADRAAEREQLARERARLLVEQRPHRGRGSTREDLHTGHADRLAARRALVRDAERAITRDARARVASGTPSVRVARTTECGPLRHDLPRDEIDLSKPIGRYDCVAVTQDVRQRGKVVAKFGLPFVAAIEFRRGRFTWCKNNPAPSERGESLAFVRLKPACLGLPPDAKPLGNGYVMPDD